MWTTQLTQFPTSSLRSVIKARPNRQALYACGFNAHGQLLPNPPGSIPQDLHTLTKVAEGDEIHVRCILWSLIILEIDGALILRGFQRSFNRNCEITCPSADEIKIITGSNADIVALTHDGAIWTLDLLFNQFMFSKLMEKTSLELEGWAIDHIAIAGNEEVCVATHKKPQATMDLDPPAFSLHIFPNFASFRDGDFPIHSHPIQTPLISLRASNTTFTALNNSGEVYAFGDPRHCPYGRIPTLVRPLGGVPIAKTAAGGWVTAVLSRDKDLYVYGSRPPGEKVWMNCLPLLNNGEHVSLVDLEDEADVHNVGVGDGHVVALTANGTVWGSGKNQTGQLGMGESAWGKPIAGFQESWVRIGGERVWGKSKVVGVWAGEAETLILTERDHIKDPLG